MAGRFVNPLPPGRRKVCKKRSCLPISLLWSSVSDSHALAGTLANVGVAGDPLCVVLMTRNQQALKKTSSFNRWRQESTRRLKAQMTSVDALTIWPGVQGLALEHARSLGDMHVAIAFFVVQVPAA